MRQYRNIALGVNLFDLRTNFVNGIIILMTSFSWLCNSLNLIAFFKAIEPDCRKIFDHMHYRIVYHHFMRGRFSIMCVYWMIVSGTSCDTGRTEPCQSSREIINKTFVPYIYEGKRISC